ncbi:MAG TPA: ATP-binding protein [Bacteroidales bacterium]|nr:ATP-binding protein [Bacteroidales bacterium]HPT01046.1 ATP-binding protein [Bacteroidales bacterium]
MNEIVILSGKGGTGKTSIAAALASLAGNEVVIADCDVDASNMHLLLQPDFHFSEDFYSGHLARIHPEKCMKCGLCIMKCRFEAIILTGDDYMIDPVSCEGCGYCQMICPLQAISMEERLSGKFYISRTRINNVLVHASLDIAAGNSGKLVAKVKSEARKIAVSEHIPFIIVDGPPGIGCPVISSLAGATFVLIITEPTVSGIHDLERLIPLIRHFRARMACIINKSDINISKTKEIHDYLKQQNILHIADIPYDSLFMESMVKGLTITETGSPLSGQLVNIWTTIKEFLKN